MTKARNSGPGLFFSTPFEQARTSRTFEASQTYYDLMVWGTYRPEPDWSEQHFTDEEAREHELYLLVRDPSQVIMTPAALPRQPRRPA
jgi:hypothetical protein